MQIVDHSSSPIEDNLHTLDPNIVNPFYDRQWNQQQQQQQPLHKNDDEISTTNISLPSKGYEAFISPKMLCTRKFWSKKHRITIAKSYGFDWCELKIYIRVRQSEIKIFLI